MDSLSGFVDRARELGALCAANAKQRTPTAPFGSSGFPFGAPALARVIEGAVPLIASDPQQTFFTLVSCRVISLLEGYQQTNRWASPPILFFTIGGKNSPTYSPLKPRELAPPWKLVPIQNMRFWSVPTSSGG